MRILVLTQGYPSDKNKYSNSFVHSRNLFYKDEGIKVDVLNFMTSEPYIFEGIEVYPEKELSVEEYDLILSHAPNLKNHLRFLRKNKKISKKVCFFFHGHEVLKMNNYYPENYYEKKHKVKIVFQKMYDWMKLWILKKYIIKHISNLYLIFVSEWMKTEAFCNLGINESIIYKRFKVINNAANGIFFSNNYNQSSEKIADFITIRPLNNPKYGIDIVHNLAIKYPNYTFHIYGKGSFYEHNKVLENMKVFDDFLNQEEIPSVLDKYRYALMPTRLDAQGVMMCEMATYGIPLITSDLPVCHEMLDDFENVQFINNNNPNLKISDLQPTEDKNLKFSFENTVQMEINLFKELLKE